MIRLRSLLVLSALLCGLAHAETLLGVVVGVADGDTITVLDAERQQHKIRLSVLWKALHNAELLPSISRRG